MGFSNLHQTLMEHNLLDYEGKPLKEITELQRNGEITVLESGLLSLTTPEWKEFKRYAKRVDYV